MSGTSPAAAAARTTVDLVVLRAATWRVELTREHPSLEDVDKAKAMFISCVTDALKGDGYSARRKVWSPASRRGPHRPQRHPSIARRTLSTTHFKLKARTSLVVIGRRPTPSAARDFWMTKTTTTMTRIWVCACLHHAYNSPAQKKNPTKRKPRDGAPRGQTAEARGEARGPLRAAHIAASDSKGDTMAMATL